MSFLIIESGSTKADWAFVMQDETIFFQTQGLNPATTEVIKIDLLNHQIEMLKKVEAVYFYGAGIVPHANENIIQSFLQSYNPNLNIEINTDLTAAIKATAGDDKGIVCILGTGSHSCVYDGDKIIDSIPSLGYLLSDEGSGNHIGKEILKSYFYNDMYAEDKILFEKKYKLTRPDLLEKLYKTPGVSAYLASFTIFLNDCSKAFRNNILGKCFEEFIQLRIKKYNEYANFGIYFVGSIAFHFQEELRTALSKHDLKAEEIIDRPMTKLINYHKNKIYVKRD